MAAPQDVLSWASMTAVVNEIKSPNSFLQDMVFQQRQSFPTEEVELSLLKGGRDVAPLIRKDGEAVLVDGYTEDFVSIKFPTIRIKRPQSASEVMFTRRPGSVIFPGADEQLSAIEQHLARDLQRMSDLVANRIEFMCSEAITGTVTLSAPDEHNFEVDFDRPAAHDLSAATVWSDSAANPFEDFLASKRLINDEHGLAMNLCIMSKTASAEFLVLQEIKDQLDNRRVSAGEMQLQNDFNASGAIFLGRYYGVDVWEYGRALGGQDLIRTGKVEMIATGPSSENWIYYGAIPDMDALGERLFVGERFSKSWIEKDPSVRQLLLHSRPIPIMRRPGSVVSLTI